MDASLRIAAVVRRTTLVATATALVAAPPAVAGYAPQLSFKLDPATPGAAAAIDSTITQPPGDTPSRTVTVSLPPGFTPNLGQHLGICTADQEAALSCPAASQMGHAAATVSAFGATYSPSGPVYYGGPVTARSFRLIVLLHDVITGDQKLIGIATQRADTGVDTVFDGLPNLLATSFNLHLDGGDHALLLTPAQCGAYNVTAAFVSQLGEQASGSSPVTIGGCTAGSSPGPGAAAPAAPVAPSVSAPARPRLGVPRLTRSGTLTFTLSAPARVTATVTRAGRRVGRRTIAGRTGANRVRLGRRLRTGGYVVTLAAVDRSGRTVRRRAVVRVR